MKCQSLAKPATAKASIIMTSFGLAALIVVIVRGPVSRLPPNFYEPPPPHRQKPCRRAGCEQAQR